MVVIDGFLLTVTLTLEEASPHTASVVIAFIVSVAEPAIASALPGVYVGLTAVVELNVPLRLVVHNIEE